MTDSSVGSGEMTGNSSLQGIPYYQREYLIGRDTGGEKVWQVVYAAGSFSAADGNYDRV